MDHITRGAGHKKVYSLDGGGGSSVTAQSQTASKENYEKALHAITLILQIQRHHLAGYGTVPDKRGTFRIL